MTPSSIHVFADYSDCERSILENCQAIERLLMRAADAARATVVTHYSHRKPDGGVSTVFIIQESHLSIKTFPEEGYAVADFFTCGESDALSAHPALQKGLGAKRSKIVTMDRGRGPKQFPYVRGHRRVNRVHIDCTGDRIPAGIRIGSSPGRGLGVFATRDFEAGEKVYVCENWLVSFGTVFQIETDAGQTTLTADELGCELTLEEMAYVPDYVKEGMVAHFGLKNPSDLQLRECITNAREREVVVTSFDGLVNHSENANLDDDDDSIQLTFDGDEPHWFVPVVASKPIRAGEELFWDYNYLGFETPNGWKK